LHISWELQEQEMENVKHLEIERSNNKNHEKKFTFSTLSSLVDINKVTYWKCHIDFNIHILYVTWKYFFFSFILFLLLAPCCVFLFEFFRSLVAILFLIKCVYD
jgi:hypothetical protein